MQTLQNLFNKKKIDYRLHNNVIYLGAEEVRVSISKTKEKTFLVKEEFVSFYDNNTRSEQWDNQIIQLNTAEDVYCYLFKKPQNSKTIN